MKKYLLIALTLIAFLWNTPSMAQSFGPNFDEEDLLELEADLAEEDEEAEEELADIIDGQTRLDLVMLTSDEYVSPYESEVEEALNKIEDEEEEEELTSEDENSLNETEVASAGSTVEDEAVAAEDVSAKDLGTQSKGKVTPVSDTKSQKK